MKRIIKDYFTFSKKERVAVVMLLLLIAFFIAIPYFYPVKSGPPVINKTLLDFVERSKTRLTKKDSVTENTSPIYTSQEPVAISHAAVFAFDPNTIAANDWKRLGLTDKTIRTILNYRSKGGKFRSPEDIRKIWGMRKEDADRLIPFVQIQEISSKHFTENSKSKTENTKTPIPIDINTATMEDWKSLPGIGEVLANRIMKFRERAGSFGSIEQVRKTYGISDSLFGVISPYLQCNPAHLPKLNINTVSAYELRMRTGIADAQARAIILYRNQYGPFQAVTDLKKIVFVTDSVYQRIVPYIQVDK